MTKEEFYDAIIGENVVVTGGCDGLGFSCNGIVSSVGGDAITIGDMLIVLSSDSVEIDKRDDAESIHYHIKINNNSELFATVFSNS